MDKLHRYSIDLEWTGNLGSGTSDYAAYTRAHEISVGGKPKIPGSSDPAFRGDNNRYNPEELLVAALASCHMLWYLHLCAVNGIVVVGYTGKAEGNMKETANGSGSFQEVCLRPEVIVTEAWMIPKANELHQKANEMCFIANSCNFPVHHEPICRTA